MTMQTITLYKTKNICAMHKVLQMKLLRNNIYIYIYIYI